MYSPAGGITSLMLAVKVRRFTWTQPRYRRGIFPGSSRFLFAFFALIVEKSSYYFNWFRTTGGVEAIIQFSIALAEGVVDSNSVFINSLSSSVEYHPRYERLYAGILIKKRKFLHEMLPGDVYITTEGVGCPRHVPNGVRVFVWLLANYLGCRDDEIRYLSHNQNLASFTYMNKQLKLPSERIIHPYISPPIVERAIRRAGLQHDGVILFEKSALRSIKDNLVLLDDDVPEKIHRLVEKAARAAGGIMIRLADMNTETLMESYEKGKIVIDWCMRGSERCPLEASLFGAIAITNDCATGSTFADFPIPAKYLFPEYKDIEDDNPELLERFTTLFKDVFDNYWSYVPDFEILRRTVLGHSPSNMVKESIRFLATIDIDERYQTNDENPGLISGGCRGCRQ